MTALNTDWKQAEHILRQVRLKGNDRNEPVTIETYSNQLQCIGIGTDAAVFQYQELPAYAFKVFTEHSLEKKDAEESVYLRIGSSPYFAQYYGKGANFLVLSFEEGVTLYDCLLQGIKVPRQVMEDVEQAKNYVRSLGLNPRDIHLKNVLLQNGRAKVLDVSEYIKEGDDHRWEHLSWAYDHLYSLIEGKQVPSWILDTVKQWYVRVSNTSFSIDEFAEQVARLFSLHRK